MLDPLDPLIYEFCFPRAAPPEAHEWLISPEAVADVPLAGLSVNTLHVLTYLHFSRQARRGALCIMQSNFLTT